MSTRIKIHKDVVKRGLNYEVYVNHTTYRLNSKRAANDFLRGVDNYLNSQYDLLNINLINVYGAYRRMSSYLDSYDLNAIRQQIREVENAIELTLSRSSWDNYSSFSFDKLGVSLDILVGILKRMEAVGKHKKYTVLSAEVGSLRNSCELQLIAAREFNFTNRKHKANNGKIIEISKKIINFNK